MSDNMNFDLVSPERSVASFKVTNIHIPGSEGDMTAMLNHAPILTTLRPGILSVTRTDGVIEYVVTGGFAQITPDSVTVLAERASEKANFTKDDMDLLLNGTKESLNSAVEADKDSATKTHAEALELAITLGLN